jgi:hypothetical protein
MAMDRSPWAVLGIEDGASAADIRRAYARRVKDIRPDEDAAGFQRLVEARDLALRLASDAQSGAPRRVAQLLARMDAPVRNSPAPSQPITPPKDRPKPPPFQPASDVSEAPAGRDHPTPEDILARLRQALRADGLAGWQSAVGAMAALTRQERAAIEKRLIESLSAFAEPESDNYAGWPRNKWPFFDLLASLGEEFGWQENDRVLYQVLDAEAAQRLARLLRWAQAQWGVASGADISAGGKALAPVALADLHPFYDDGRDLRGLNAYWAMLEDKRLWRPSDAPTYLFLPAWDVQDGRYVRALLGLFGWVALALAFAPWRSAAAIDALPWLLPLPAGGGFGLITILPIAMGIWYLVGSIAPSPFTFTAPTYQGSSFSLLGPLWDGQALFAFPLWALRRGLYARAAIGFLAWLAIAYQIYAYPDVLQDHQEDAGFASAVVLVLLLHLTAGAHGQRWLVYKLQRTIASAHRRRIFDPRARSDFLRAHGTRNPAPWRYRVRQAARPKRRAPLRLGLEWPRWYVWAAAVGVALLRIVVELFLR